MFRCACLGVCTQKLGFKTPQFFCYYHRVSLDRITISVHGKFICITVNYDKTQYGIYKTNVLDFYLGSVKDNKEV